MYSTVHSAIALNLSLREIQHVRVAEVPIHCPRCHVALGETVCNFCLGVYGPAEGF